MNDASNCRARHPVLRRVLTSERAAHAIARTAFRFSERRPGATNPERTA